MKNRSRHKVESDEKYIELEIPEPFTPNGVGWQKYDTNNLLYVPKGAIIDVRMVNNSKTPRTLGLRADGSNLNRFCTVHPENEHPINLLVTVNENTGLIETYCDSVKDVTFYHIGHWMGVSFTEIYEVVE